MTDRGLNISREQPADVSAVHAIHTAAFGQPTEADLVDALRQGGWADISLVAKEGGAVVGHVLFSRLDAPMRALALAPVAVAPSRQRSGIGSALIHEGLSIATAEGWDIVFVLGDPAYYERFGFSREMARGFACVYAGDYFMALALHSVGIVSGAIRYPPPFAALE